MREQITPYLISLSDNVKLTIAEVLSADTAVDTAKTAFAFHFNDAASLKFQRYYAETVDNPRSYLDSPHFFKTFKNQYALQGIDNAYLVALEDNKGSLLCLIEDHALSRLYLEHFASAAIQHKGALVRKNLGSFFAKFVHTFKPADYCALDNPIKNYFGLSRESFFVALLVTSHAYKEWASETPDELSRIKAELLTHESAKPFATKITDLKLLDLIFWFKANGSPRPRLIRSSGVRSNVLSHAIADA